MSPTCFNFKLYKITLFSAILFYVYVKLGFTVNLLKLLRASQHVKHYKKMYESIFNFICFNFSSQHHIETVVIYCFESTLTCFKLAIKEEKYHINAIALCIC